MRVALVEHGKMGGTCINVGCVHQNAHSPSRRNRHVKEAGKIGVNASVDSVNFTNIVTRMRTLVDEDSRHQALAVEATPTITWFKETESSSPIYYMQVGAHIITAEKKFLLLQVYALHYPKLRA